MIVLQQYMQLCRYSDTEYKDDVKLPSQNAV